MATRKKASNVQKARRAPRKAPSDGARRARLRSPGYAQMSAREQWEEDKALGILDWDGT
jgi:hypothetical protein